MSEGNPATCPISVTRLWVPPIAVMAVLVVSSHFSGPPAGPDIIGFDKLAHFFVFGLLGTLFFRCLRIQVLEHRRWIQAFLAVFAFSFCDEFLQLFNPERSFDPADWVADWSGALLAIFLYRNLAWYRNLLERRLWGRFLRLEEA